MKNLQLIQLGNGGGLAPEKTNSAFLIHFKYSDTYMLFDCGMNIMSKLLEFEEYNDNFKMSKLSYVFISHIHDDHIGSLETLVNYQKYKTEMNHFNIFFANTEVSEFIALKKLRKKYECYHINDNTISSLRNIHIIPIDGNHNETLSNGLYFIDPVNNDMIYISGDTKATKNIEQTLRENIKKFKIKKYILMHDYSHWNEPDINPHMCLDNMNKIYSSEFIKLLTMYHTGEAKYNCFHEAKRLEISVEILVETTNFSDNIFTWDSHYQNGDCYIIGIDNGNNYEIQINIDDVYLKVDNITESLFLFDINVIIEKNNNIIFDSCFEELNIDQIRILLKNHLNINEDYINLPTAVDIEDVYQKATDWRSENGQ
jgi:ribonuclease BN (tRNA processing enzyme)